MSMILTHGKVSTYNHHGCRCEACTAANTAHFKQFKERRKSAATIPHGTVNGYDYHRCRCPRCKEAKSQKNAVLNPRRKQC
jgi:hypothetical protein